MIQTANGARITIVVSNGTVSINGYALVVAANYVACNGVVHVIDHVLIPPCGSGPFPNLVDVIQGEGFSQLFKVSDFFFIF
jgi:hypothetical protein